MGDAWWGRAGRGAGPAAIARLGTRAMLVGGTHSLALTVGMLRPGPGQPLPMLIPASPQFSRDCASRHSCPVPGCSLLQLPLCLH